MLFLFIGGETIGRRRKPIALHLLQGNKAHLTKKEIEKRKEAEGQLKPNIDRIKCPSWLGAKSKRKWNQLAGELKELGLLTNLDVNTLAIYCDGLYRYEKALQKLENEGEMIEYTNKAGATNLQVNPQLRIANQFSQIVRSFGGDLGLTPTHRLKLVVPKEEKKEDPFGELFDP